LRAFAVRWRRSLVGGWGAAYTSQRFVLFFAAETSMAATRSNATTLASAIWPSDLHKAVRAIALLAVGVAVMTIAAKIKVPGFPVPVTLQTLALPLIAAIYGSRLGTATVLAYLAAGFAGLPVFTNTPPAVAGPLYFLGATGGYLLAYPLAAYLVGYFAESGAGRSLPRLFAAMLAGSVIVFGFGFVWLAFIAQLSSGATGLGASAAFAGGVVPFIVPDLVKVALAAALVRAGWNAVESIRG
jgi:biotin transport system substrate-specific component